MIQHSYRGAQNDCKRQRHDHLETRFGPNWLGVRCGAQTKAGGECQCPAVKRTGRWRNQYFTVTVLVCE
jgi:hypothetical protein